MKIKIITALLIILGVLFCCFREKKQNENEVVFQTLQLGTFDGYINKVIKEFELQNPEVKIKWVDVPYSEGEKRTLAALLSDRTPDLINLTPDFSALASQKNALYEIPKEALVNYPESLYSSLSYNGKFFAIPFYLTSAVTFANTDLMKKAGISKVPTTYKEMYAQAEKIKKEAGIFVEMPTINENDTLLKILNKHNINAFSGIDAEETRIIFKTYKELFQKDLIPKESLTQGHREALEKYMSSQTVYLQAGANFLNIIKENAPKVYETTVIAPQITGSGGKYDCSLMNLIIPEKAKHKEMALKFALFLTNKENQLEFAKLTSVLPVNKEALADDYFKLSNTKQEQARKISAEQINNLTYGIKNNRNGKNYILLLNKTLAEIMTGKTELNDGIKNYNKTIQEFIN